MRLSVTAAIGLAFALSSGPAAALSPDILKKEEGWFWYKDPKEKIPKPKPEEPPPPPPAAAAKPEPPKLFSVDWLSANLETLRKKAIDEPTDDNVRNYLYAQRVMFDKSEAFSKKAMDVVQKDPLLDERNRMPVSNYALNYLQKTGYEAKKKALQDLSTKGGLWFFFDTKCRFCMIQKTALDNLKDELGFTVYNVSMDGKGLQGMPKYVTDQGQYKAFGLQLIPAVVLAVPPNKFMVISQGATSTDDIKTRLLANAKTEGLLDKELEKEIFILDRGLLTTDDMNDLEQKGINPDDPGTWVKYLREQLGGRY